MNQTFNFNFNGVDIPFEANLGDINMWIDATEMAKSCSKSKEEYENLRPSRWIRSKEAQDYIKELIRSGQILDSSEIVQKRSTHSRAGSYHIWMKRKFAIRYAQWISVKFAIWVDERIEEILTQGYSFMTSEYNKALQDNQQLQNVINMLQPKADYYDQVLQDQTFKYNFRDLCLSLNLKVSNKDLVKLLIDNGYAYRSSGNLYLYGPWSTEGYLGTSTELCPDGKYRTELKWSESGRRWIHSLAIKWGII